MNQYLQSLIFIEKLIIENFQVTLTQLQKIKPKINPRIKIRRYEFQGSFRLKVEKCDIILNISEDINNILKELWHF
jgi:hypothetical protein